MKRPSVPALDPRRYGFSLPIDSIRPEFVSTVLPDKEYEQGDHFDTTGIMTFPEADGERRRTIEEISHHLEHVYCEGIGYEVRLRA